MLEIGLGQMGMDPDIFWDMTPAEFYYKQKGFFEREALVDRAAWERTRWAVWILFNIQLKPSDRIDLKDMIEFPWEKTAKKSAPLPTTEELERIRNLYEKKK